MFWLAVIAAAGISWCCGWLMAPDSSMRYLQLQQASDSAHRWAVLLLPSSFVALLLGVLLRWLVKRVRVLRWIGAILIIAATLLGTGVFSYIVSFDRTIEQRGFAGQWLFPRGAIPNIAQEPSHSAGPFFEEEDPGIVSSSLANGDVITLDRKTLARKTQEGDFRWNRPRPGLAPGGLWLLGDEILFFGPSQTFEDDVLLAAYEVSSGTKRWSFHCLGNVILPPVVRGEALLFASQRPSLSSIYLMHWTKPEIQWQVQLSGSLDLPPRWTTNGIEVAQGGVIRQLDEASGAIISSRGVCKANGVSPAACREGRVAAWDTDEKP